MQSAEVMRSAAAVEAGSYTTFAARRRGYARIIRVPPGSNPFDNRIALLNHPRDDRRGPGIISTVSEAP